MIACRWGIAGGPNPLIGASCTVPTDASALTGISNLVDLLRYRATHDGRERGYTHVLDGETTRRHLTYEQLDQRARAIAARLQALNLAGERALLLYPTGFDFLAAFFGCLYAGVVAVPAYPPRRNRNLNRIQAIAADAAPRIALTVHEVLDHVELMAGETPILQNLRWWATDSSELDSPDDWTPPQINSQSLAFLQYTSGSTGAPKGVMLSHANLMHNASIISRAFAPRSHSGSVFWLPLYHDMGLIGGVLQPLYQGNTNTLFSATHFLQKPVRWLRLLSDQGAGVSGGPNFAYELCIERVS
jgi:acyl-CoA synthetase (AMP-forming)/AMP-acid ligase II